MKLVVCIILKQEVQVVIETGRKMKSKLLLLFIFTISLLSVGLVSAVECNADLSQGEDNCTVSSSFGGYYAI